MVGEPRTDAPWLGAFDPAANMRALGDIQRRSLEAAGQLVERLAASVDGSGRGLDQLVDLWGEMTRRSPGPPTLTVDETAPAPALHVTTEAGQPGSVEVWLHNGTGDARHDLRPHCAALHSSEGNPLVATVSFAPAVVEELPGRSSRGIVVTVAPEAAAMPGTYRGLVQISGLSEVWAPFAVTVTSGAP